MQTVVPRHQVRSAFMRNAVPGWVYLETTLNKDLVQHLRLSPGIVRRNGDIIREQIDFADWTSLLEQRDLASRTNLAVGDWARVLKGTYKGDIGYVVAVENGTISLLLVPRLPTPSHLDNSKRKRLRSTPPPEPKLFDPLAIKHDFDIDPVQRKPGVYRFNGYTFEHGLIYKTFNLRSVTSTAIYIPTHVLLLFQSANHPAYATSAFPRPLEWHFAEGEVVFVRHTGQRGLIKAVGDSFAEVEFRMDEDIVHVSMSNLLKRFEPGDFVEVMGGPFQGQSGWIEGGSDTIVNIAVESTSGDSTEVHNVKVSPFSNSWLALELMLVSEP